MADMIRELSDGMLDLLGDHLEAPTDEKANAGQEPAPDQQLAKGLDQMMRRVEEVMEQTRTDRMSDFATWSDLEKLKRNLDYTRNDLK